MEGMERTRSIFVETVKEEYSNYCKARGEKESTIGLTEYLINKNVIEDKTINRFLTVTLYPRALEESNGIKKLAIYTLTDIVCLKYDSINLIIHNYLTRFKLKKRVNIETSI